jgi:hypothetical protein
MQDFQMYVVDEKAELDKKYAALIRFMESNTFYQLTIDEQNRMTRQLKAMKEYSDALSERISNFK